MKSNLKRLLSMALVLVMVLSLVPATVFAAEGDSAADAAQNVATGAQYADLSQAISEAQPGQIVKALADAQDVVYDNQGVILDLNGYDLSVTVSEGVTVSAIDSATDNYEGEYGTLTTDGKVATTVKTGGEVKSYVTIAENGSYSFHRYYAAIAAISLKPTQVALGYRAEFRGDEAVKNAVVNYGYELWVNNGAHKTYTRTDALTKSSLTLRLQNIMAEGNEALNAIGSTATIGGNAFVTLELNGEQVKLSGTEKQTTLRQVVESVNANVSSYGEAQLESVRAMITSYAAWMEGWNTAAIFGGNQGEGTEGDLKVEIVVDVVAQGNVLSQDATMSHGGISATVPAGAILEDGATQLVLTITEKTSSDSDVTQGEGESLIPLDVHIAGISADNTTPIIICLGEVLPKALNIGNYDLFHVEDGKTVPMTHVSIAELDAHNEFSYDPATGSVTVAMASFSEIALRNTDAQWTGGSEAPVQNGDTYYIYNADQLRGFAEMVGGMNGKIASDFAGKTVVLHADLNLNDTVDKNDKVFYPIGYYNSTNSYEKKSGTHNGKAVVSGFNPFKGTFDGNGHTISNFYQNTWEMFGDYNDGYSGTPNHYRDGMGLFGKVYGGTVKNLTVKDFSSDGEYTTTGTIAAYADCGATFENIAIFNCNPRVYNIGNGGIVGCVGWYAHEQGNQKVTFKNITVDNTNKISALWGSWDVACGGLVGQYYPTSGQSEAVDNLGIHMDNCHVTAQIDVNNDVCANYQYYAYRYAGILIGSVRENINGDGSTLYPETGRVYPNMDGITAENCTVGFGDWNDYYYCELVANSIASYTHDYQFSRLTQVASVDVANMQVTTLEGETVAIPVSGRANYVVVTATKDNGSFDHATENATCYHFVDGAVWNHETAGKEDLNGDGEKETLIENNQHIYLEFNNLVTGYGWGVTSKGVEDMDGVEILDKNTAQKFNVYVGAKTTFGTGATVKLSDLFYSNHNVNNATVQAFVSPVGDDSTVTGIYTADTEDWKNGTLTLSGKGAAEIIITDYYFCKETKLAITVNEYTVSFAVPDGADEIASMTSGEYGITLPTEHSFTNAGVAYTLVGWLENPIAEPTSVAPEFLPSSYIATKNTLLYPVYKYSEVTAGETSWTLVKDASTLKAGDEIIIAASGSDFALGTTQNNNNRVAVSITKSGDTITIGSTVQVLTLETGTKDNTFAFNTGSGYLCAASSSNNYLRTETQLSANSSWTISINSAGVATVKAQGTYTRNLLKKNSSSALFACYGSGQHDIAIYKKINSGNATTMYGSFVDTCAHNYVNGICTICSAIEPSPYVATQIGQISAQQNVIITMTVGSKTYALPNNNGGNTPPAVEVAVRDGMIETTDETILWNIVNNNGELTIYPAGTTETWLYCINDNSGVRVGKEASNIFVIDDTYGYLYNNGQKRYIGIYNNQDWRSYTTTPTSNNIKDQTLAFYVQKVDCSHANKVDVEAVAPGCENPGYTACQQCADCGIFFDREEIAALGHTEVIDAAVAATCNTTGLTEGKHCSVCSKVLVAQVEVPVTGEHTDADSDNKCDVCGTATAVASSATISFESKENRTSYTTSKQVWEQNGITVTNTKGASTSDVGDFTNPARFYKGSNVTISYTANITKIEIVAVSDYVKGWQAEVDGEVAINGTTVTIIPTSPATSVSIENLTAQARAAEITVYTGDVDNGDGNEGGNDATIATETIAITGITGTLASDSSKISWSGTIFTVTNTKGSTAIRTSDSDYYRIYANSKITISGEKQITKISFTTTGGDYLNALKTSLDDYSVSVSGNVVTVTLADAVETIEFTASAQIRINKVDISYYEN